jgi:dienelactone hydrolase
MVNAGVRFQALTFAGAKHAFANPAAPPIPGFGYDAWADAQSWAAVRAFFDGLLEG